MHFPTVWNERLQTIDLFVRAFWPQRGGKVEHLPAQKMKLSDFEVLG